MKIIEIENLWKRAIADLLRSEIHANKLNILAKQTNDSIRRIDIYESYKKRALQAVNKKLDFIHTSIPFVLAQRSDLSQINKVWVLYIATYFGKSNKSKWELFNRATFDNGASIMLFENIQKDLNNYFKYLSSFNFFDGCTYSNHRKFTAKRLTGENGVFVSMEYFVRNIDQYSVENNMDFHSMYKLAEKIPNFGRLAAFDFSSSLVKCGLNIEEPQSMYAEHSTGPLNAIDLLLRLTKHKSSSNAKFKLCSDLMKWFQENTKIFMTGQVLEDALCNWNKNTSKYIKYSG
jgi:Alpha-glutamyl/putrescinyl thymine pyrophosphorylase clade 3